ncbi:MAG: nucleotidyltransferase [Deltaproteobacteria bacterium]|nr:nucleotidyltransferase [Deltaproteobacteria bacterium]
MKNIVARKRNVTDRLERICQTLELTEKQYETAENRYGAVGEWLASSENAFLRSAQIYSQGSISIGTSVKPLKGNEFDVDLVCYVPYLSVDTPPKHLKKLIGDRLRSNGIYEGILEEKPRCWRINYANEFHLDITPSIRNPDCPMGGELVPDKLRDEWKASNPKGYKELFIQRAELQPMFGLHKAENREFSASIEPLPDQEPYLKGLLRRCVQVYKRHRDEHFQDELSEIAPISIILTTLASKSYVHCVTNYVYDTEFDVLVDVVRYMHLFINKAVGPSGVKYSIMNETTVGENFAEKWNKNPNLSKAFFGWQQKAVIDLESLPTAIGLDNLRKSMNACFGESVVAGTFEMDTKEITVARSNGLLSVLPAIGLTTQKTLRNSVRIPHNTFFGR